MMLQPNYASPSVYEYQRLVDQEAWLLQVAEYCEAQGLHEDARWVRHMKKFVSVRRKCLKAALRQKTKTASAPTLAV
ncbi:hypothetical protein [Parageobacillus thermoglucosidasius]|uniref:Transposase n=1 Tax=Parageobacillus thermoglucosidasius TaxID=1426 RepID=A0A1B7KWQ1_PARTM|nr:hypothetical protein [Parageobacillus thermoglucosidasius]OAT74532.1 hypothetical protein A7K69_02140 [Parageobacillus thermoglucosidasius]